MTDSPPPPVRLELLAMSLAVALAVALLALSAALLAPVEPTLASHPPPGPGGTGGPSYCLPAAAVAFPMRLVSAAGSAIGEEQAPLAQRYAADLGRSGKIDSPRGGGPSRRSHHSISL